MTSVLLNLLPLVLWYKTLCLLVNVPYALEKYIHSGLEWNVLLLSIKSSFLIGFFYTFTDNRTDLYQLYYALNLYFQVYKYLRSLCPPMNLSFYQYELAVFIIFSEICFVGNNIVTLVFLYQHQHGLSCVIVLPLTFLCFLSKWGLLQFLTVFAFCLFFGHGIQWLAVGSQFPNQVLNLGHSDESSES